MISEAFTRANQIDVSIFTPEGKQLNYRFGEGDDGRTVGVRIENEVEYDSIIHESYSAPVGRFTVSRQMTFTVSY